VLDHETQLDQGDDILVHLRIEVRAAYRFAQWAWYAVDCGRGEILEYELEYGSPSAARSAGLKRLEELLAPIRAARRGTQNQTR
jgi:hypothetical protein